MAEIVVEALSKAFGRGERRHPAVDEVSFEVPEGQLLVLLGPSGCGKTTTLRCLAGLEMPDSGSISFGQEVVFDSARRLNVPPHRRDLGLVFQSFALWPHLSARANVEFPLKSRRIPRSKRREAVDAVARLVELNDALLAKHPGQLSGGQQQRVALARALVSEPAVLLFDEPLSNLDANLREQLRMELRALHDRLGFTGVYVTHDLTEALALGDWVAVMAAGRIEQIGSPAEVFQSPATAALAEFLGLRRLCGLISGPGGWHSPEAQVEGELPDQAGAPSSLQLFARPQGIHLVQGEKPPGPGRLRLAGGVLKSVSFVGDHYEAAVSFGDQQPLQVQSEGPLDPAARDVAATVEMPLSGIRFYQDDGRLWSTPRPIPVRR